MQDVLEQAALACGYDPRRFRSHSLRIGGATALYHVRPDVQLIQRFGRWSSSAFQGYLWEAHERQKGLAQGMATDHSELTAPASERTLRGRARDLLKLGFDQALHI